MFMDKEGIKKIIPHRDPMLLIDEVTEMEFEKNIKTKFFVSPNREIFKGHFPSEPVLPGVYTVEIMAQTSDVLILSCERYANTIPLFIGIDKVKFIRKISPGDTIIITSEIISEKTEKAIVTCEAKVYNHGELACVGNVTLAMR
ncbi:MAG: 3-hydroxyacyl-ACP dehydratase FabZ [Peptostreptococcaceae bacterium]|nr:3-hydroxyacyl-ACP dehydratase FabZ [Peptostreptococcaceae bacterium]